MTHKIKIVTTYEFDGKTFRSLKAVDDYVDNCLGALIDTMEYRLPPKQAISLLNLMRAHSKRLTDLLSVDTTLVGDDDYERLKQDNR